MLRWMSLLLLSTAAVALVVAAAVGFLHPVIYRWGQHPIVPFGSVWLYDGDICFNHYSHDRSGPDIEVEFCGFQLMRHYAGYLSIEGQSIPAGEWTARNVEWLTVAVPAWMPLVLCLPYPAYAWLAGRRLRRRRARGQCLRCGYDLRGNVSGRCPECGVPCGTR